MSFNKSKFRTIFFGASALLGVFLLILSILLAVQLYAEVMGESGQTEEEGSVYLSDVDIDISDERIEVIRRLDASGYKLRRDSTEYQIELFRLLAHAYDQFNETNSDSNLKNYATLIAQNFVADFFTLSNKHSRTDVGGLQFVSEELVDDFRNFAVDTFYLYLNQHIETFGHASLPTVETTTVLSRSFGSHWLEKEVDEVDESEEDEGMKSMFLSDNSEPEKEEIRTIVIEIEWTFAPSRLARLNEFQTSARFILLEGEDGVRIHAIELIEEESDEILNLNPW